MIFAAPPGITLWLRLLARQMNMWEVHGTSYSGKKNVPHGEKRANREHSRSQIPIQRIASPRRSDLELLLLML